MSPDYARMNEVELYRAVRDRYGAEFDFNDKGFLQSALERDDGLLHELLYKMAQASD